MKEPPDAARTIGYADAADLLNVPKSTLYTWVHRRVVPHIRLGARVVRFDARELQAWIVASRVPAKADNT